MEPKNRFDRDIDIYEPTQGTSRFERFDRGLTFATRLILEGGELTASLVGDRVQVRIGDREGLFPSFEIGVTCIGEAVESGREVETVPGACSGESPVDNFLVGGGIVTVQPLGNRLHVTLNRKLPERTFVDKGVEHRVYRKGIRKAVGYELLKTVDAAFVAAREEVLEGSLMSVT